MAAMAKSRVVPINKKALQRANSADNYNFEGVVEKFGEYERDPKQQHKVFTELGFSWHDDEDICFSCQRNGSCPDHPQDKGLYVNGRLNMDATPSLKKIRIVVDEFFIADAMENHDPLNDSTSYLDVKTGEVITITSEVADIVETDDMAAAEELPDWQKGEVEIAKKVLSSECDRFVLIPRLESHEGFRFMEEFIDQLKDELVAERLAHAVRKSRPFRRFKDALGEFPEVEQQWFRFKNERMRKEVADFLQSINHERIELAMPPLSRD
jgi:hypothetical protein